MNFRNTALLLVVLPILAIIIAPPATASPNQPAGVITLVSRDSNGVQAAFGSFTPSVSADGRYVAFQSSSANLVPNDSNNFEDDIFVHDRLLGHTALISRHTNGAPGDGNSIAPSISADGRYVAFTSEATTLVDGDTNGVADIFVHDRQEGQTTRVSVHSNGPQGNDSSHTPSMSGDGRYVAFASHADNLIANDTAECWAWGLFETCIDIFVHDRLSGQTKLVSRRKDGTQANQHSISPAISANGRYVVFRTDSSNLTPPEYGSNFHIFRHDLQEGDTIKVSVHSNGTDADGSSGSPAISADGNIIAFSSEAANLIDNDPNGARADVFVRVVEPPATALISRHTNGAVGADQVVGSTVNAISADGRFIAFYSDATNLVDGDTNERWDVFLHDRLEHTTVVVSWPAGGGLGNGYAKDPTLSGDGRTVVFASSATNLIASDANGNGYDIFAHALDAVAPLYEITGRITAPDGSPLADVLIDYNGGQTRTGPTGAYAISGLPPGAYTITPRAAGVTFAPRRQTVSQLPAAGVDFVGYGHQALAGRFAPYLRIHPDDGMVPIGVDFALDHATCIRHYVGLAGQCVSSGPLTEALLGQWPWQDDDQAFIDFAGDPGADGDDAGGSQRYYLDHMRDDADAVIYASVWEAPDGATTYVRYWLYWFYNSWRIWGGLNHHEGDWEYVQIALDALMEPSRVAYAQHAGIHIGRFKVSGGSRRDWDDLVEPINRQGDHPILYPGLGSHASYFGPHSYLVSLDDAAGLGAPLVQPAVRLMPAGASWATFRGRWGEKPIDIDHPLIDGFSGPRSPGLGAQWGDPAQWAAALPWDEASAIHIFKPRATAALNCQLGVVTLTGRRFGYLDGVPYVEVDSGEYVTNESAGTTTVILHDYSAVIRRVERRGDCASDARSAPALALEFVRDGHLITWQHTLPPNWNPNTSVAIVEPDAGSLLRVDLNGDGVIDVSSPPAEVHIEPVVPPELRPAPAVYLPAVVDR